MTTSVAFSPSPSALAASEATTSTQSSKRDSSSSTIDVVSAAVAQVRVAEAVLVENRTSEDSDQRFFGRPPKGNPPSSSAVLNPRSHTRELQQDFYLSELDTGRSCNRCANCPGFISHEWRQSCVACHCPRTAHAIASKNWVFGFERLGLEAVGHSSRPGIRRDLSAMVLDGYAWSPPGLVATRAEDWMRQLPQGKIPKLNTDGEKYRDLQLVYQSPKQDQSLKYCHHIDNFHANAFQDFICARNDIALNVGVAIDSVKEKATCAKCAKMIVAGGLAVIAPKFGPAVHWHPACFTCSTCDELLVDLTHCVFEDEIFCERHYAEKLKPRCGGCDELIFSGQYTKAVGKYWHCEHFACAQCETVLTGEKYVLGGSDRDSPSCLDCYEKHFTHKCGACEEHIGLDSKDIAYKEVHWHEKCFCCKKCDCNLEGKPFALKNNYTFCGQCYEMEFASRCDACGDPFRPGMKKMEYKSRKWHDQCFRCTTCQASVGAKPFIIPNDKDIYCVKCFNDKFATRCTKCKQVMTTGGVTFKKEAWHRECFICTHCSTMLAGQKFASKEDKPYCAKCFGELFAKRCTKCTQPITGSGGTRFISFEDRHWHSDCFRCALCKESMAGRGFITDGEDIICPECARNKLMGASVSPGPPPATATASSSAQS